MATRSSTTQANEIREYIIDHVSPTATSFTKDVAEKFGISRQAAHRYINRLVSEGILIATGETKDKRYALKSFVDEAFEIPLNPQLEEDIVWRERVRPLLEGVAPNVLGICAYGFTEMLNNAIDHSGGTEVHIRITYSRRTIDLLVRDNGIGIFKKIQSALELEDEAQARLELAKGKFTTDPARHTGEGIFFTSKAFDNFWIISGKVFYTAYKESDYLLPDMPESSGTEVFLSISPHSKRTQKEMFDRYSSEDEYDFSRTVVPVRLARNGDENLISRSQGKRLVNRFEKFKQVILDFEGVESIGQAFADEIFRVFANEHPQVSLSWVNANEQVESMILRAKVNNINDSQD